MAGLVEIPVLDDHLPATGMGDPQPLRRKRDLHGHRMSRCSALAAFLFTASPEIGQDGFTVSLYMELQP